MNPKGPVGHAGLDQASIDLVQHDAVAVDVVYGAIADGDVAAARRRRRAAEVVSTDQYAGPLRRTVRRHTVDHDVIVKTES